MAARRDRMAQRRKALGLTQEDLAALLKVERSTVLRWERGVTAPAPWSRPKLARVLKLSEDGLADLLDGGGPAGTETSTPAVPRQLPPTVADFTGRAAELAILGRMLDEAETGAPGMVVISAIGGTAGVGKTALALYWAHRIAAQFPDGQLHMNLRGFDPSGTPVVPAQAIRIFLDALGVPPESVPADPKAQAGLYRSLLANRRMLIVLDNARDEEQVRPLLPASLASLVIVTSRNVLAGLAATDGARLLSLDVLSHAEAVQLLTTRIGHARASADPEAVAEIARLCACLPLALAVAAARAAARKDFPLAALAAELRDAAGRLDALETGDLAVSVRAVFSWSYQQLSPESARMFRLLGLHPGPDISVRAAASLAAADLPGARRMLRELTAQCLIAEHVPGRYAFHDLLRGYAAAQARDAESETERTAAVGRVLDHYLHAAARGSGLLNQARERIITLAAPEPGVVAEPMAGYRQAMGWFEAEHRVLLAAVDLAVESRFDRHAWQLSWTLSNFLQSRGYYQEWASTQRAAVAAAIRLGDSGQAVSSRFLVGAYRDLAYYYKALGFYFSELELYRQLGDRLGEATVHQSRSALAERQGRPADALRHAQQALRLYEAAGFRAGEAEMLNAVGRGQWLLGDYQQARDAWQQALAIFEDLQHPDAHEVRAKLAGR